MRIERERESFEETLKRFIAKPEPRAASSKPWPVFTEKELFQRDFIFMLFRVNMFTLNVYREMLKRPDLIDRDTADDMLYNIHLINANTDKYLPFVESWLKLFAAQDHLIESAREDLDAVEDLVVALEVRQAINAS